MAIVKDPSIQQRALVQLISLATQQRTTTYEDLALALGTPSSGNALGGTLGPILGDVFHWCVRTKLPMLTSLVVRKSGSDEGMPGRGFWELAQTLEVDSRFPFFPEGELADAPRKVRRVYTDLQHLQCYTFFNPLTQMNLDRMAPSQQEEAALDNTKIMRQALAHSRDNKRRVVATEFNVVIVDLRTTYSQINDLYPNALYEKYEIDQVKLSNVALRLNEGGEKRKGVVITLVHSGWDNLLLNLAHCAEVMGGWDNLDSITTFAGYAQGEHKVLFDRYKSIFNTADDEWIENQLSGLSPELQTRLRDVPAHVWGAATLKRS